MNLTYWKETLLPSEFEAVLEHLDEIRSPEPTPDEVFEAIIEWEGGIATAYRIKSIISRVYGIEL